jgi:hypothetical protein
MKVLFKNGLLIVVLKGESERESVPDEERTP